MSWRLRWTMVGCTAALALGIGPRARAADAGAPTPSAIPACISVKTESRWVPYGYNHVVILTSGCERASSCVVSTDVNPQRQEASIPPKETVEVTTFMGSPASAFAAKVACQIL